MPDDLVALRQSFGQRYDIARELGRGGMGAVYLARDLALDRPVALKVLPPSLASIPDLRERFLRETRTAAGFSHPNIVPVFAVEERPDFLAFAMGFVEGESLAAKVAREGALAERAVVRLLQDVAYALAYAHGRGVVHRDIKPDNIMIERATGRALVMDFGIARSITPAPSGTAGLTRVGEVVGTPEYMSPEQASGDAVDGRSDLYALGLVAWFALTGDTAITGDTTQRILVKQLTERVPPIASRRPDLPASLCAVVDRCCAKQPEDRYPTAESLVEALDATQLRAVEIPVAIRLVAAELTSAVTRTLAALLALGVGCAMILSNGNGNVLAIGLVVAATAWVILMNALREVRRLRHSGYAATEVQRLLSLTLAEQDEERVRRAADAGLRRRRRSRVIVSWLILAWQQAVFWSFRARADASGQVHLSGTSAGVLFFASLLGSAMAIAILLASPFRRTLPQRLFAWCWLGQVGLWVFGRLGPRTGDDAADRRQVAARAPVSSPAPSPAPAPAPARAADVASSPRAAQRGGATAPAPTLSELANELATLAARVERLEQRP